MTQGSPVRRHYLVSQLKRLRAEAKLSQEQVADEMGWDVSKLYRIENGRFVRLNTESVAGLCRLYGADDSLREELVAIAKAARKHKPWWFQYEEVAGNAFYGLENEATKIQEYAVGLIPGLLQHPDYIEALMSRGLLKNPEQQRKRLDARRQRQTNVLERDNPPQMWSIIDESALRCLVGGRQVMRVQLEHLLELVNRPNLDIQVLPLSRGMTQPYNFTLMSLGENERVGYIDVPPNGHFFEGSDEVADHTRRFELIQAAALPLSETPTFLHRVITNLKDADD
ncbi:helix-turn-helix domain-containing protein [Thermobifida alba]|uniref:helix-turn-helix domain-containing protein n=1 Tax=Thermobifida alba TaxID=53522 RepID=UPI0020BD9498|nr:helix-turn-helix transcriptional regulator [Thermobifida alba]